MMSAAIEIQKLTKSFVLVKGIHTSLKSALLSFRRPKPQLHFGLKELNLTINHGETVAIIGKNGSGKSTLLGIISRIYKPTTGTVRVNGRMCTLLDPGAGFHPELSGRENIFFNGAIMGMSAAEVKDKIEQIISFSELEDFIDSPVKTYSKGMLMRLGFAIVTETDPDILLIDEALAVGDAAFQQKCYDRINSFMRDGKTIVFVTHDLDAAKMVASRTIWMNNGEVLADGDTESTIAQYLATVPKHEHIGI